MVQLNAFDQFIGNSNWEFVQDTDTFYLYFSRTNNDRIDVYSYHLSGGDSTFSRMDSIITGKDGVKWNWENKKLTLTEISDSTATWKETGNDSKEYLIIKTDSTHLSFIFPGDKESRLKRTIPITTFLVRSRYDFKHGTRLTDSTEIKLLKKRKN